MSIIVLPVFCLEDLTWVLFCLAPTFYPSRALPTHHHRDVFLSEDWPLRPSSVSLQQILYLLPVCSFLCLSSFVVSLARARRSLAKGFLVFLFTIPLVGNALLSLQLVS
jgi:hypothetical protein